MEVQPEARSTEGTPGYGAEPRVARDAASLGEPIRNRRAETLRVAAATATQGSAPYPVVLFVALVCLLVGCAPSKPKDIGDDKKTKEEAPDPNRERTVNLGKSKGTFRDDSLGRDPLWDVKWESAQLDPKDEGKAVMHTVTGLLYTRESVTTPGGKVNTGPQTTTTFEADSARIDAKEKLLILRGHVKMVSENPKATLTCDLLRYDAKNKNRRVAKAIGNVLVVGEVGRVGPTAELWASPDLNVVATPSMFNQP